MPAAGRSLSAAGLRFGTGNIGTAATLSDGMAQTDLEQADKGVAEAVAPARDTTVVKVLGWLSEVADQPQLITVCAGVLAAGLVSRNGRLARAGARMLAAELVGTKLKSLVKRRVDRTRPHVIVDGGAYEMQPGNSRASELNSFPSGHTAGAVAVARAFGREYPQHRLGAYGAAAAIAAVQIPRCQHYPSDLAAGALIGALAETVVDRATSVIRSPEGEGRGAETAAQRAPRPPGRSSR